ncbi:acyltransferase [Carboxylicivirga linearis]|uniref:Acyltransferase n=1 Tax=Carboxylicivirga linearis TaxID=1628157 RepID=A0ABS5JUH3_9BACT|nr:acyltransferase [Carboxylicivirga linearis]MBS2098542.1 acyltransferase [Carboxylicivirga linearis]
MFVVFKKLISAYFKFFIRHLYWLYRLSAVKGIKKLKVNFPVCIEGKGQIAFGPSSVIDKRASLKVTLNSALSFESNTHIGQNADIRIDSGASLTGKENCSIGNNSRIYINNHWEFGNNANIATYCSIFSREAGLFGRLIMSDNSYIADNCIIDVADDVIIGKDVAIGPGCTFYTHDHEYDDLNLPAWNGKKTTGKIEIGNKSWIGSNVTVLPNVSIGKHVVVAANSVVTKSIPDNTVWAGVPARQIKSLVEKNDAFY